MGGEYPGSVAYLVETAPAHRHGLAGSVADLGSSASMLSGAVVADGTATFAGETELRSWAWRLAFLLGGVLATIALLVQRRLRVNGFTLAHRRELPLQRPGTHDLRLMAIAILYTTDHSAVSY